MTTAAQLRKAALSQPQVEQVDVDEPQQQCDGMRRRWQVAGRDFAALGSDGRAHLRLAAGEAVRMAGELPGVEVADGGVLVELGAVNGMALNFWVHEAWKHAAPRSRVAALAETAGAVEERQDDFGAIGAPARRALHEHGIADLDALASRPREEVASLHGIGPTAVARLSAALAERGVDW